MALMGSGDGIDGGTVVCVCGGVPVCKPRIELKNSHRIPFLSIPVTPFLCAFRRNANSSLHSTRMHLPILACIRAKIDTHQNPPE